MHYFRALFTNGFLALFRTLCQAIDLRRPLKSTPVVEKIFAFVREHADFMETDRSLANEIETMAKLIQAGKIWELVKDHMEAYVD